MDTKPIKNGEGFLWLGVGIFICILSWQTGFGFFKEPGPGFIAFLSGLLMIAVGAVFVLAGVLSRTPHKDNQTSVRHISYISWFWMLYSTALLLVYAALVEPLGFILTTLLVMFFLFYDWKKKNWVSSLVGSCATTAVSYIMLVKLLGLPFPNGIFG